MKKFFTEINTFNSLSVLIGPFEPDIIVSVWNESKQMTAVIKQRPHNVIFQ